MSLTVSTNINPLADQRVEGAPIVKEKNELNAQVEGAVEGAQPQQKFEWNVERLLSRDENHSLFRTWFVRVLALVVGIPTLLLDLVRLGAFQLGLVNGKSFSLIDKTSDACQALAHKVSGVYHSMTAEKELTLEGQNAILKQRMQDAAKKYIAGYKSLNGGYFHSNNSFSTPHALSAEKTIQKAKTELASLAVEFISTNARSADNFTDVVDAAMLLARDAISNAAKDDIYIENKVARMGPRLSLANVAIAEFDQAFQSVVSRGVLANQFIDIAHGSEDFVAALRKGVESGVLSESQAKEAMQQKAEMSYMQALDTGAQEAETVVTKVLNDAIKADVLSRNEAVVINEGIQPPVEALAVAAAKDIAKEGVSEVQTKTRLIQASKTLQKAKRLKDKDVSAFLTSAEAAIAKAKIEVEAERARLKEESDRLEAQRVALVQKVTDQKNLLGQFEGMLDLISQRQSALTSQFASFDEMTVELENLAKQLKTLQDEKVTIRGSEVTVFRAAAEYVKALTNLLSSEMTAAARKDQMDALEAQGFTAQTIAKIEQLKALEPTLRSLINRQAALAADAEKNHDELVRLKAVYRVFRKNNIKGLQKLNRQAIVAREAVVERTQKTLNERHLHVVGKSGIRARLTLDQPSNPVNVEPEANRAEVAALVEAFRKPTTAPSAPKLEEELAPARSTLRWIYDGVATPFRWAGIKV